MVPYPMRLVLGIESTAHTAGVGIVTDDCVVIVNERAMYVPEEGGLHPRVVSDHHTERFPGLVESALSRAAAELDVGVEDVKGMVACVAFSQGPGLGPCLRIGATVARTLSLTWNVPLVGVNHCVAHLEVGRKLCDVDDPVLLYASGGNTQVISQVGGRYRVIGETQDIGIGNMLDKFGREVGWPFPGGPRIEQEALKGEGLVPLPYSVKGMDVAFSGILTAAISHYERDHDMLPVVSRSLQETCFSMLTEVTERALAHLGKDTVLLGGGVACNSRLQEMVSIMCNERGGKSFVPPRPLLVDNGAMIAWNGWLAYEAGIRTDISESQVNQGYRTDEVDLVWL